MINKQPIVGSERMEFTRRDTNIAKGLFIVMMLVHHLFYDYDTFGNFNVSFFVLSEHQVVVLAQYFKLCIAGFAFLTFYGMTRKYMSIPRLELNRQVVPMTIKKYISLQGSFLFVYVFSLLTALLMKEDLGALYSNGEQSWLGYGIIDGLGMADFFHTPTLNVTWWYMSFAVIIICLFPVLYILYDKCGMILVVAAAFLPGALQMETTYYGMCLLSMVLGIFAAKVDLFVKLRTYKKGNLYIKFLKAAWCMILCILSFQLLFHSVSASWYFAVAALTWTYACYEFISPIKLLNIIFDYIGQHSMTIFLTHTFLYYYYAKEFIYGVKYGVFIVLLLLVCSLLISVVMDLLKKVLHYQSFIIFLQGKVVAMYHAARL
ncbi:MAG: hypothetical protein PHE02_06875 [Lachnospiraceae bacterium]|nr:hypothetical protein [Lachnospiraceae bacterium]